MGPCSITEEVSAEPDGGVQLQSVEQRLARGTDMQVRTAANISPEKRKAIEDLLRKGTGVVRTAIQTSSGAGTVTVVRDALIEKEPELFKRHMLGNLHHLANKTAATIERGLNELDGMQIKAGQIPGLAVALGILIDKSQILAGEASVSVIEHRLKVDPDAVRDALLRLTRPLENDAIDVTPIATVTSVIDVAQ